MRKSLISVIIPCYNEAENIPTLIRRINKALRNYHYEVILVNDGSTDNTLLELELASQGNEQIKYLSLSRNFGHQTALKAGIDYARGDCLVTIDADLQKPPEHIPAMITLWQKGYDIVTATCENQGQSTLFKKWSSRVYYRVLSWLADHPVISQGADFRLIDRKVADIIRRIQSQNLYLRGIFSWMGFSQTTYVYCEEKRHAGKTKYGLGKMLSLASNGITSFSIKPLRLALALGVFFAFLAFGYGIYAIVAVFIGKTVQGWASLIASVVFLSGIQLIVLGVIGEYVGKIYRELNQRPLYLISKSNLSDPVEDNTINQKLKQERRPVMT
ncbi:glycosyltransferase [Algoriphagus terrigena]|uniref:glycosyltransferase n=1 Tax=Algoriphagus terrigena TaxID=344884 RepID=UPI000412EB4C|nr:glycosyltransferase [Algoriphagus terrigena]